MESTCPRCGTPKPRYNFACKPCWATLPPDVRREIGRAYRKHGALSVEWVAAARRAFEAWEIDVPSWLTGIEEVGRGH